ncbi:hypothetical protein [Deefgea piscis]|uniref:hypothetical protein n=1 Tax=Deefgea piscis TaxID=2739061 RepID=UPI001C826D2C|nr:hypothetical protein [Deefgea piscis]QZA80467.1 hypothetical protein K4H25_13200 [Deefgea piscis]
MSKAEQLIKELADLLIKYDANDWQLAVAALKNGATYLSSIENMQKQPARKQNQTKRKVGLSKFTLPVETEPETAEVLMKIYRLASIKNSKIPLGRLRELYIDLGGKEETPKERTPLARMLTLQISKLSVEKIENIKKLIQENGSDIEGDYERWFNIIRTNRLE